MEPSRVHILLGVWEETGATLAQCRAALEVTAWIPSRAIAALRASEVVAPSDDEPSKPSPAKLLSKYKERARELHDISPGTFPRSLVWVTARATKSQSFVAAWDRHRYFLGAPVMRLFEEVRGSFGGPRRLGGYLRLERDADSALTYAATRREEAMLAFYDARWVLQRLSDFSRQSGMRVAVELRGSAGWITAGRPDATLAASLDALATVDGVSDAELRADIARLDSASVRELLDRYPERRKGISDCGWASHWEAKLALTERVLSEVDLTSAGEGEDDSEPALEALEEASSSRGVHELLVAKMRYTTNSPASFPDVLDRLLVEHDLWPIGAAWRSVSRAEALTTWRRALTKSLAYDTPLLDDDEAEHLAEGFITSFEEDALFFRNGDDNAYTPVLGTTLEKGAAVVDGTSVGLLFIGDED